MLEKVVVHVAETKFHINKYRMKICTLILQSDILFNHVAVSVLSHRSGLKHKCATWKCATISIFILDLGYFFTTAGPDVNWGLRTSALAQNSYK